MNDVKDTTASKEPSKKVLNGSRIKLGFIGVLCNGDEAAFSPFHTVIIRTLGGGDVVLGLIGSIMQSVPQLFAWVAAVVLRVFKFNRKAMVWALGAGALVQAVIVVLLFIAGKLSASTSPWLYAYIGLITFMLVLTGAQQTIIASWIGDLVPTKKRGWFVSGMAITSNIGLILFQLFLRT